MQARGFTTPVAETISRLNVVLITIDTLCADHGHCYGYGPIKTPALDKLTKEGVRFAQAFTPSPTGKCRGESRPCHGANHAGELYGRGEDTA